MCESTRISQFLQTLYRGGIYDIGFYNDLNGDVFCFMNCFPTLEQVIEVLLD
ncbi:hypothetical protein Syun_005964 [Stephania yunnanensis]|uniref:Uncharacterized protein n=1 Tax=Stephania yunnanensis TaxID=152371 RepID=A0AAP0PX43_9MAGN